MLASPHVAYLVRPLHSYSNYYTINVHGCQFCRRQQN
nr:MAG TPA: hypothetical protein [Caudoviricetes sp.]